MDRDGAYYLAELERAYIDLGRIPRTNYRGRRQAEARIKNLRNKLAAMRLGREAWEIVKAHDK